MKLVIALAVLLLALVLAALRIQVLARKLLPEGPLPADDPDVVERCRALAKAMDFGLDPDTLRMRGEREGWQLELDPGTRTPGLQTVRCALPGLPDGLQLRRPMNTAPKGATHVPIPDPALAEAAVARVRGPDDVSALLAAPEVARQLTKVMQAYHGVETDSQGVQVITGGPDVEGLPAQVEGVVALAKALQAWLAQR